MLQGERFVIAVEGQKLALLYMKVMRKAPTDIFDFIEFIQNQNASVLGKADAVWLSLRAGSALMIPAGWFVAEGFWATFLLVFWEGKF